MPAIAVVSPIFARAELSAMPIGFMPIANKSGKLTCRELTDRGCGRQVTGASGAAGAVGASRDCQAPAEQAPASASELGEAGNCRPELVGRRLGTSALHAVCGKQTALVGFKKSGK